MSNSITLRKIIPSVLIRLKSEVFVNIPVFCCINELFISFNYKSWRRGDESMDILYHDSTLAIIFIRLNTVPMLIMTEKFRWLMTKTKRTLKCISSQKRLRRVFAIHFMRNQRWDKYIGRCDWSQWYRRIREFFFVMMSTKFKCVIKVATEFKMGQTSIIVSAKLR